MAARARCPEFMAGMRAVRLLPRVGGRPVRSVPAARRHEDRGEHEKTGRVVAGDVEHEGVIVASMTDEEGVRICLASFRV